MKVTVKDCRDEDRNLPWLVTYYVDRKPVRKYFKTQREAQAYADHLRNAEGSGANMIEYTDTFGPIRGTSYSLPTLIRMGMEHLASTANRAPEVARPEATPSTTPLTNFIQ